VGRSDAALGRRRHRFRPAVFRHMGFQRRSLRAFKTPGPSKATTYTLSNTHLPAGTRPANLEFIPRNRRCQKHQSCQKPERNARGVSRGGKGGAPPQSPGEHAYGETHRSRTARSFRRQQGYFRKPLRQDAAHIAALFGPFTWCNVPRPSKNRQTAPEM